MPVYAYQCDTCNKESEVDKPMSEYQREEKCEVCNSVLRRLFKVGVIYPNGNVESKWKPVDWKGKKIETTGE